jgi:chromosome segregation protein
MRLSYIETSGFRGFRDIFRLDFSPAFTVIHGRNGVGKSTVCDAIEFALSGTIDKYRVDKTARESLSDYFWWRPGSSNQDCYVSLGVRFEDGQESRITRFRDGKTDADGKAALRKLLEQSSIDDTDAMRQLVKTTIIRDEWIAEHSLDLSEYERFRFVSATLGSIDIGTFLACIDESVKRLQSLRDASRRELHAFSQKILQEQAEVARLKTEASKGSLADASQTLARTLGLSSETLQTSGDNLQSAILQRRARLQEVMTISVRIKRHIENEAAFKDGKEAKTFSDLRTYLSGAVAAGNEIASRVEELRKLVEGPDVPISTGSQDLLAKLAELGAQIGLQNGHCPLCRSSVDEATFLDSLRLLSANVTKTEAIATKNRSDLAAVVTAMNRNLAQRRQLESNIKDMEALFDQRAAEGRALRQQSLELGLNLGEPVNLERLDEEVDTLSRELASIESAAAVVDASRLSGRLAEMQTDIEATRKHSQRADSDAQRYSRGLSALAEFRKAILRTNHEILDERLAAISPLLDELYRRLRPHMEWHTIHYEVRGDIRRFLNLFVGEDLNPQFIFSSGQRRATGLAFLLAVHLARGWGLKSLVLDDPVQHIDDYRAMNLVEVLAAMSREGRQIICAVEDAQLAKLLARRLRTSVRVPGTIVHLGTDDDNNPAVTLEPVFASTTRTLANVASGAG